MNEHMPLHPILRPPTRVSRLYPVLTLVLMIGSSTLVYAWQNSSLSADAGIRDRERQIAELKLDNTNLNAQTKLDAASLQTQKTQIDQLGGQLSDIEKQLADKTQALKDASTQLTSQKDQLTANSTELQQLFKISRRSRISTRKKQILKQ
jgi:septal ring factor EnvC (AmiA/AmiB activator)